MEYAQWDWCSQLVEGIKTSLNPYSNGICSMRLNFISYGTSNCVLILILMEYAQWEAWYALNEVGASGLNPYSNGICSMRIQKRYGKKSNN